MQNKKIRSSIVGLVLGALIIGGTFAWLSANDTVTNKFLTAGSGSNESSLEIYEVFNKESGKDYAGIKTNGDATTKKAQVKNESDYDSLIKVDFTKKFSDEAKHVDNDMIKLGLLENNIIEENTIQVTDGKVTNLADIKNKWVKILKSGQDGSHVDDYDYYYIGNVAPNGFTTQILDNVFLNSAINSNPNYKNVQFDVVVNAKSIQSTDEAITDSADNGFGLDNAAHSKLVAALKAVANGSSEAGSIIPGATETK